MRYQTSLIYLLGLAAVQVFAGPLSKQHNSVAIKGDNVVIDLASPVNEASKVVFKDNSNTEIVLCSIDPNQSHCEAKTPSISSTEDVQAYIGEHISVQSTEVGTEDDEGELKQLLKRKNKTSSSVKKKKKFPIGGIVGVIIAAIIIIVIILAVLWFLRRRKSKRVTHA